MTFVPLPGQDKPDFKDNLLVFPTHGAGLSAFIACDLLILNDPNMKKLGYYRSEFMAPGVSNDGLTVGAQQAGTLIMPCEIYQNAGSKLTLFVLRGGPASGKSWKFKDELVAWVKQEQFREVSILSATINPIRRERESNRLIPRVFGYLGTKQFKADPQVYEKSGLTKFGLWIQESKKKAH